MSTPLLYSWFTSYFFHLLTSCPVCASAQRHVSTSEVAGLRARWGCVQSGCPIILSLFIQSFLPVPAECEAIVRTGAVTGVHVWLVFFLASTRLVQPTARTAPANETKEVPEHYKKHTCLQPSQDQTPHCSAFELGLIASLGPCFCCVVR